MPFGTLIQDEQQERNARSLILIGAASFFFLLLIARLFYIQVIQGQINIRLSQENAMRLKVVVPPRGRILDRNGEVLARNRPSYSICVLPYKLKNRKQVIHSLCQVKDIEGNNVFDSTELDALIHKAYLRRFEETRLKEDISLDLVSIIEEHSMELPGIIVETESRREYTLGSAAFHVLGYMSEIPEEQFDSLKDQGYFYGDLMGKAGIEKQYECLFRGKCGQEYIEVNAYGKSLGAIPNIPRIEPVPGNDITLTLDARLQKVADIAFPDSMKGAVVALDPRTGEVLVMYSSPSIDPNIFSMATSLRSKNWVNIATDPNLPLNNRATTGTYTPGSTFKLISSISGLETGKLERDSHMPAPCHGSYRLGSRVAHCWSPKGHGFLNLVGAIQQSCNVYFYQVGLKLGDEVINKYATMLGLGAPTGIDFPVERSGWLSGEEAYNKKFEKKGWKWTAGLVMDLAIGQTQVVTPIQLALMIGGLGNGKTLYKPYLVKEEIDRQGHILNVRNPLIKSQLDLKQNSLDVIHEALKMVIQPGGTGGRAAVPGIDVGGKTGSAENPQGDKTHALFVGVAPVDNPVIAIAVVVENAGHGGSIAAPIAGDVMRYYFSETEEGRKVLEQYHPDSTTLKKLADMVKPIKEKMSSMNLSLEDEYLNQPLDKKVDSLLIKTDSASIHYIPLNADTSKKSISQSSTSADTSKKQINSSSNRADTAKKVSNGSIPHNKVRVKNVKPDSTQKTVTPQIKHIDTTKKVNPTNPTIDDSYIDQPINKTDTANTPSNIPDTGSNNQTGSPNDTLNGLGD
jgi:penicillin-binding protein 2